MDSDNKIFMKLWIVVLFAKVLLGTVLPMSADEAYYWTWSHDLHWSYFDHPPFIAWLFWLGHPLEHLMNGARIPGIIFSHFTILFWRQILKPYLQPRQLVYFLIIAVCSPMIGIGSILMTPDLPLLFFWSLALWSYLRCLEDRTLLRSFTLGLVLGLGFCSKYNMIIFFPLMLLDLSWEKKWKKLRWFDVPVVLIAFGVGALPVWIWNIENNFDSFLFQLRHGLGANQFSATWPINYFFEQVGIIFPIFVFFAVFATRKHLVPRWLMIWGWGPLVFFLFTSLKGRVEANWPAVAYPAVYAMAVFALKPSDSKTPILLPDTRSEKWALGSALLWLFLLMIATTELAFDWIPLESARNKIKELHVYDPVIPVAKSYVPFYASSYQMAAVLTYSLRSPVYRLRDLGRRSYYDYVEQSMPQGDSFFIVVRQWDQMPEWTKSWSATTIDQINAEFKLVEYRRHP
jgi:4-amino-4-deoxy-L-arabinose transferase-like glycosyltransferase